MSVPTLITDLSTTAASNSPAGSASPTEGDDHIRALSAFIARIAANTGNGWTSPYLAKAGDTATGTISLAAVSTVNSQRIGYLDIPRTTSALERGKCFVTDADVTVNLAQCGAGYTYCIYNSGAAAIDVIAGSGVTLTAAGGTAYGSIELSAGTMMTLWCNSSTEVIMVSDPPLAAADIDTALGYTAANATRYSITVERVRQIQFKILRSLRNPT